MENDKLLKCWYCQEEGETDDNKLIRFNGQYWHPPCLKAYRKVRVYLAKNKGMQNPLFDNLLTTRKLLGVINSGRNHLISRKQ